MRCRNCDYSLWNVVGRTCPECGTAFLPSAYSFQPNQVRYCCPGCDQEYYGTSTAGHLIPPEFTCVRCGAHCSMDTNMVLRSLPGLEGQDVSTDDIPWCRRASIGRWRAWWQTFKLCMGSPGKVGMAISHSARTDTTSWFASLLIPAALMGLVFGLLMLGLAVAVRMGGRAAGPGWSDLGPALFMMGFAVGMALFGVLLLAMAAGVSWFVLKFKDPNLTYSKVLACWAYGATPTVLVSIPCVGTHCLGPAMLGWVPALAGIMLSQVARTSGVRVAVSVVVPPLALILTCGTGYAAIIYAVVMAAPGGFPPPPVQSGSGAPASSPDGDGGDEGADGAETDDTEMEHGADADMPKGQVRSNALAPWTMTAWALPSP